jgi:spore coat protein U-like protein
VRSRFSLALLLCIACPHPAWALLCGSFLDPMIVTASDLSFGTYLPGSSATASATVTVSCTIPLDLLDSFHVSLSAGNAASPGARYLRHGSDRLNYNLYTDSGYTTVWGDNTGGSTDQSYNGVLSIGSLGLTAWGRLPQGQYVPAGTYSDRIIVTVTY